jgi:hypothetical protein
VFIITYYPCITYKPRKIGETFRKLRVEFTTKKDFDSRFDVIIWMIEISCRKETLQMIRGYMIGKRYKEKKKINW